MPFSMTAFARETLQADFGELRCEIRSVNHRYLEPSFRLPEALRGMEPIAREQMRKQLARGKVDVSFQLSATEQHTSSIGINHTLLAALAQAADDAGAVVKTSTVLDPLALLQWPGVVIQASIDDEVLVQAATALLKKTLAALIDNRHREGLELQRLIEVRLAEIAEQIKLVREKMPEILQLQRDRLHARLADLKAELDESRLEQEMAMLANKADVAEELDRLETHLVEVAHILEQKGAVGRRLDFMMQELNREANTLSSKSLSSDTTQVAVNIKVLIEQMREQIQNVE